MYALIFIVCIHFITLCSSSSILLLPAPKEQAVSCASSNPGVPFDGAGYVPFLKNIHSLVRHLLAFFLRLSSSLFFCSKWISPACLPAHKSSIPNNCIFSPSVCWCRFFPCRHSPRFFPCFPNCIQRQHARQCFLV